MKCASTFMLCYVQSIFVNILWNCKHILNIFHNVFQGQTSELEWEEDTMNSDNSSSSAECSTSETDFGEKDGETKTSKQDPYPWNNHIPHVSLLSTLRPRQNGRHFADDTFNRIFVKENVRFSIKFSLKFVPKGPINNIPALVQIMAWRRPGNKPLSEPVMVSLLTHICVSRLQWVNKHIETWT